MKLMYPLERFALVYAAPLKYDVNQFEFFP